MIVDWEELKKTAEEEQRIKDEQAVQALRDQAEKEKQKAEAMQADLEKLAQMMHESESALDAELEEEERRHLEAIQDIRTRNRAIYGIKSHNTTSSEALRIFGNKLIEK